MLKKLLKYEFIATGRIFLPLYGALLVVAIIQRLFLNFNINQVDNLSLGILAGTVPAIFGILLIAVIVTSFIMMIQRFYKNLLTSEGYLMFTLPVSVAKLIWSKLIVILVWMILSAVMAVLACCILVMRLSDIASFFTVLGQLFVEITEMGYWGIAIEFVVFILTAVVSTILSIYLSMAIGQLSDKHKLLCSVGAYIGLNIVVNNILLAALAGVAASPFGYGLASGVLATLTQVQALGVTFAGFIVLYVAMSAVYFILTRYILTKKLNLA